jgi:hypothetical protein
MIRFACPRCKSVLESVDDKAGQKIACPKCQQRLQIPLPPPTRTILAPLVSSGPAPMAIPLCPPPGGPPQRSPAPQAARGGLPPDAQPAVSHAAVTTPHNAAAAAVPVVTLAGPANSPGQVRPITTVRCHVDSGARVFDTTAPLADVLEAVDDMLDCLGLHREDDGAVRGHVRHSYSFFCATSARGDVRQNAKRGEIVIDVMCSNSMPVVPILLSIFAFPIGLILCLIFYSQGQGEARRLLENAARNLKDDLTNGRPHRRRP